MFQSCRGLRGRIRLVEDLPAQYSLCATLRPILEGRGGPLHCRTALIGDAPQAAAARLVRNTEKATGAGRTRKDRSR